MLSKKKLLFVTTRFPYPQIGGDRIRVSRLTHQLARSYDVTLVCFGSPTQAERDALMRETGLKDLVSVPFERKTSIFATVQSLLFGRSLQAGYFRSKRLQNAVDDLICESDIAIFHLVRSSGYWRHQASVPVVLEMCDSISANFLQTAEQSPPWSPWGLISRIEAGRTSLLEREESTRFDLVTLHTQVDADRVGIPPERLLVSTQGVDTKANQFTCPSKRRGAGICFIGKMDFFPNIQSAEWFARNVLPLLPDDIELHLIGYCPDPQRRTLQQHERVRVFGQVESLQRASADSFCAVAPMKIATGIQNKVLEYFSLGLPSVVSPSVALGLLPQSTGCFLSAQSAQEWASAILALRNLTVDSEAIAHRALRYVREHHSWDAIGSEYLARLQQLTGGRVAQAASIQDVEPG